MSTLSKNEMLMCYYGLEIDSQINYFEYCQKMDSFNDIIWPDVLKKLTDRDNLWELIYFLRERRTNEGPINQLENIETVNDLYQVFGFELDFEHGDIKLNHVPDDFLFLNC